MAYKIDLSKIPTECYVDIIDPDGNVIIHTNNVVTFDWIRLEIKKNKLEGYTMRCENGKIYPIFSNGTLRSLYNNPPEGLLPGEKWMDIVEGLL